MTDLASVKPAVLPASTAPAGVSSLPAPVHAPPQPPHTSAALQKQLDAMLADSDTSLRFRVDDQAHRIVVSVLDHEGALILQIPSEAALAIARRLAVTGSLLDASA